MIGLQAWPVEGIGEVSAGDDLAAVLAAAVALEDGDVLAVSSKVVSKALGLAVPGDTRDEAVLGQTVRVVAERVTPRGVTRIVEARSGPVLAATGGSGLPCSSMTVMGAEPRASARRPARLQQPAHSPRPAATCRDIPRPRDL